ncbi:hypothetical protein GBAR_LOCUS20387 [Geodia barretti]|nr:hypothetical protein GBAR_LOCUS20387 [Geodia barretti]
MMSNTALSIVVQDNDGPVRVGFESNGVTVDENGGDIMVPVSVIQQIATTVSVDVEVVSGTSLEQEDYVRTGLFQLKFPSNGTSFVPVGILDDGTIELTESFTVVLSNPQPAGGVELGISVFTVTISDDDLRIGFESIEYTVDEGGTLEAVVVKSAPFDSVIEFEVAGGNFSAVRAFPDGASSPESISIFFQIPDDVIALEPPETISFTLAVLDPNPQISVDPDTTTVTILDNDVLVGFKADIITVPEDAGDVFIPVTISQDVHEPITVDILYQNGSAMEQSDFFITGPSSLTFTSNGTRNILISIADDTEDEPDETFIIALVSGATVIVFPDTITITIIDNDDETPTGDKNPPVIIIIVTVVIAVLAVLLIAAIIIITILIGIMRQRKKRQSKLALPTPEPIYDDPDSYYSSVLDKTENKASTEISLQPQPENLAIPNQQQENITSPIEQQENVAYGALSNQQQENVTSPIEQQENVAYGALSSQQQENVTSPITQQLPGDQAEEQC